MEVTSIQNGIIIDHVPAGTALKVLEYLKIDPSKTKLALIMNTDSHVTARRTSSKSRMRPNHRPRRARPRGAHRDRRHRPRQQNRRKKKPTLPEHVVNIIKCGTRAASPPPSQPAVQMFHLCIPTVRNTAATTVDEEVLKSMTTLHDIKVGTPAKSLTSSSLRHGRVRGRLGDDHRPWIRRPARPLPRSRTDLQGVHDLHCAAAASGGYTNVLIMPNTVPAMDG